MKNLILILVAILTSLTATTQVRFNYVRHIEIDLKEDSTGMIYFSSDPDTIVDNEAKYNACVIYEFDNDDEAIRYVPINKIKFKSEEVIYYGKWDGSPYKFIYNKTYGDFVMKERALLPKNRYTIYFHRDYDYYEQLSDTGE